MKKVKILTFHNAENYGATLQAYALKKILEKLNTNASFVNYINKEILKDYKLIRTNSLKSFFSSLLYLPRNLKRKRSFKSFTNRYLDTVTKKYYSKQDIEQDLVKGETYIAGSDQIFNPELTNGLSDIYTLNFGKDITKIVYGASLGNEELLEKYSNDFNEKLQSVDMLSVRENNIVKPLEKVTGKKVEKVLDPTLLLEKNDWDKLVLENQVTNLDNKKYILIYTLFEDKEITRIANYLSKETGLRVIHFRKYNAYNNELISLYTKGPADFVNAFKKAEYVITNSFHGLVFSIIFERKFYSVMPISRGGRLRDLIELVGLETRAIKRLEDIFNLDINKNIDYKKVKEILNNEKAKSIQYLEKGINITDV